MRNIGEEFPGAPAWHKGAIWARVDRGASSFRIAEEVEEDGLGEGVELGEGGAALGPQRLRPVQHLRNPPLLRQRRQGDFCKKISRSDGNRRRSVDVAQQSALCTFDRSRGALNSEG